MPGRKTDFKMWRGELERFCRHLWETRQKTASLSFFKPLRSRITLTRKNVSPEEAKSILWEYHNLSAQQIKREANISLSVISLDSISYFTNNIFKGTKEHIKERKSKSRFHYETLHMTAILRKHAYSNILKILPPRNEHFQIKKNLIFFKFLLKT